MCFASQKIQQISHNLDVYFSSNFLTDTIKSCLGVCPVAAHIGNLLARKESLETKRLVPL